MYPFSEKINTVKILFKKMKSNLRFHYCTTKVLCLLCTIIYQMIHRFRFKGNKATFFLLEVRPLKVDEIAFQQCEEEKGSQVW